VNKTLRRCRDAWYLERVELGEPHCDAVELRCSLASHAEVVPLTTQQRKYRGPGTQLSDAQHLADKSTVSARDIDSGGQRNVLESAHTLVFNRAGGRALAAICCSGECRHSEVSSTLGPR